MSVRITRQQLRRLHPDLVPAAEPATSESIVLSYGGGRQTVALCILIAREILPRPDRIVIADTGREKQTTWDYLDRHVQPLMNSIGLGVEIAARSFATVDLYSHQGTLLIPIYTETGKFTTYCSGEWKRDVVDRFLRSQDINGGEKWIGFGADETRRIKSQQRGKWRSRYPLVEKMINTPLCEEIVRKQNWPPAPQSSCWMCPNHTNIQWREIRDNRPDEWEQACQLDEEIRAEDIAQGKTGVFLHHSCVPLRQADLDVVDRLPPSRQCSLGTCFV